MKAHHVKWAQQHDWFNGYKSLGNGMYEVKVVERYHEGDIDFHTFTDYQALREWAGY